MDERKYLKIIADLFRLTGYATGIINGAAHLIKLDPALLQDNLFDASAYLTKHQNLILMQLDEDNKE